MGLQDARHQRAARGSEAAAGAAAAVASGSQ